MLFLRLIAGFAALFLLAGCASTSTDEPEAAHTGPWTPSELTELVAGDDPIEEFNRAMFAVTDFGMDYIADPLGRVYTSILPRQVIERLDNVCYNLEFPGRAISSLGSAEFKGAWDELCRFLLNTTVGIAGIFDPAGYYLDIYSTQSDFGQMFSSWGIGPGCTLVLPFLSSLNVRDTVGSIFDMAFDLKTYIPYAGSATALNRMVMAQRSYEQAVSGSADRYRTFRQLLLIQRQLQLEKHMYRQLNAAAEARKAGAVPELPPDEPELPKPEWVTGNWRTIPGYRPQGAILDTLRVMMFQAQHNDDPWYFRLSVFNRAFAEIRSNRKVYLAEDVPALRYGFWRTKTAKKVTDEVTEPLSDLRYLYPVNDERPDKLAILLPGIGGNYFGATPIALAELFYMAGWSVASLDSAFTWQFYLATGNELPGFLPRDAANTRRAISAVLDSLKEDGLFDPTRTRIALVGYSLGAMHTLKISELEEERNTLGIDRFVAINPPVELQYALQVADSLAQSGKEWNAQEVIAKVTSIAGKALWAMRKLYPPYNPQMRLASELADANPEMQTFPHDYSVPLMQEDADFLVALYFRGSISDLLMVAQREVGVPALSTPYSWWDRTALYREIDRINFDDYAARIANPTLAPLTLEELYRQSSLRSLEKSLARNPKVRVIHTPDDFLLSDEDRRFLDRTLEKRLTWFDRGGHLGNLYVTDVQDTLLHLAEQTEPTHKENGEKCK